MAPPGICSLQAERWEMEAGGVFEVWMLARMIVHVNNLVLCLQHQAALLRERCRWRNRITKLFRLEKFSRTIKSNHSSPAKAITAQCPQVPHAQGFGIPPGVGAPGQLCQCWAALWVRKFSLISNINLPWCTLRLFPCVPSPSPALLMSLWALEGAQGSPWS